MNPREWSYTIEDIHEMLASYQEERMMGDASDFVDWLTRCAEVDALVIEQAEQIERMEWEGTAPVENDRW